MMVPWYLDSSGVYFKLIMHCNVKIQMGGVLHLSLQHLEAVLGALRLKIVHPKVETVHYQFVFWFVVFVASGVQQRGLLHLVLVWVLFFFISYKFVFFYLYFWYHSEGYKTSFSVHINFVLELFLVITIPIIFYLIVLILGQSSLSYMKTRNIVVCNKNGVTRISKNMYLTCQLLDQAAVRTV